MKNKNMVKSVVDWYKENQECSYKSIHKLIIQSKNIEVARYVVALKDCLGIWQNGTEIFKQVIKEQECFC